MHSTGNPFLNALLEEHPLPLTFLQVRVSQCDAGFELRHLADAHVDATRLRPVTLEALSALVDLTESGAFRPNKASPSLPQGWTHAAQTGEALWDALEQIYPGALADWYAARQDPPPCTSFREFIERQTGIYRGIRSVSDPQAADIIRAACSPVFCLRRRLWSVPGLDPDTRESKSVVPCLDPCGLFLEFARRRARILQEPRIPVALAPSDLESLEAVLETQLHHPGPDIREGDIAAPANPRRLLAVLQQFQAARAAVRTEKEA